jgi:hypothetical protein
MLWWWILLWAEQDAFQLQQNDTNSYESFATSSKWISNMPSGKWFTCLFPHRKYTEIFITGKVSLHFIQSLKSKQIYSSEFSCTGSKAQFARDDPAFLVLLGMWLCCKWIEYLSDIQIFIHFFLLQFHQWCLHFSWICQSSASSNSLFTPSSLTAF